QLVASEGSLDMGDEFGAGLFYILDEYLSRREVELGERRSLRLQFTHRQEFESYGPVTQVADTGPAEEGNSSLPHPPHMRPQSIRGHTPIIPGATISRSAVCAGSHKCAQPLTLSSAESAESEGKT